MTLKASTLSSRRSRPAVSRVTMNMHAEGVPRPIFKIIIMAYTKLIYHIVFRPHNNAPVITEKYERDLYMYIYGFCRNRQYVLYRINGMPDHIHILIGLPATISIASFVHDLKIACGNYMRNNVDKYPRFESWERGYGAFTCSENEKEKVIHYIINQKVHHKKVSTHDEIVSILKTLHIDYDERYI